LKDLIISIDAMGGDFGPEVTVPASLQALAAHPQLTLILVGKQEQLEKLVQKHMPGGHSRLRIHNATEVVAMDESPSASLRGKKDSSMRVAINLVKQNQAQACVSAGNTGALMATARFVLKTLPGIDRPAITTQLPTMIPNKEVLVLDLGANVDSCADHLYQFAVMGSVLVSETEQIERPKVGLLNIGEEEIKGNDQVKQTSQLLTESEVVNYYGYIEGDEIFSGEVDVVVCDGFVGNVALKAMEGLSKLIIRVAKEEYKRNWFSKMLALVSLPVLNRLKKRMDPGQRNGASLLGLQGIVIKSHGSANVSAFTQAIHQAVIEVEFDIPKKIGQKVGMLLEENP
jgi:glycerol-3-phosphate acyltransferase PlsX